MESLEERLLLAMVDESNAALELGTGANLGETATAAFIQDVRTIDDRERSNWRIGSWQQVGTPSAWSGTETISSDPNAYFLWYWKDLSWDQAYDVYLTWQPTDSAANHVLLSASGFSISSGSLSPLNQTQAPQGLTADGKTWQFLGTVQRGPVDYTPYIAMTNPGGAGAMRADAMRMVPHVDLAPLAISGPDTVSAAANVTVPLQAWSLQAGTLQTGTGQFRLTVSASRGTLYEILPTEADPSDNGVTQMSWVGTVGQINQALAHATWRSKSSAVLTLTASRREAITDSLITRRIQIDVNPTPLHVEAGVDWTVPYDSEIGINAPGSEVIRLQDPTSLNDVWEVELSSTDGVWQVNAGSSDNNGIGATTEVLRLTGTVSQIHTQLLEVRYRSRSARDHTLTWKVIHASPSQVYETGNVVVHPNHLDRIVGHPTVLYASDGDTLDFRALFDSPRPAVIREYEIQWGGAAWTSWDSRQGAWRVPEGLSGLQPMGVRIREWEGTRVGTPMSLSEVHFSLGLGMDMPASNPLTWKTPPTIRMQEDGALQELDLAQLVWGGGPLTWSIPSVDSNGPGGVPIVASLQGSILKVIPTADQFGAARIEVQAEATGQAPLRWFVDVEVEPQTDAPRVRSQPTAIEIDEDGPAIELDVGTWFEFPDETLSLIRTVELSVQSHDPRLVAVGIDQFHVSIVPQSGAFGHTTIDVVAQDATGNRVSVTVPVNVTARDDTTHVVMPLPTIDLGEDGQDVWIPLSRYFADADIVVPTDWQFAYQLSSSAPFTATLAVDMSGESFLVLKPIPDRFGTSVVIVTASDRHGGIPATAPMGVTIHARNDGPQLVQPFDDLNQVQPGQELSVPLPSHFADPDGDGLTWSVSTRGDSLLTNVRVENSVELRFTVRTDALAMPGIQTSYLVVTASDGVDSTAAVFQVSRGPRSTPYIVDADKELVFQLASGSTGFQHTFTAQGSGSPQWTLREGSPNGLSIDRNSGILTWNRVDVLPGTYFATVEVTMDGLRYARSVVFHISPIASPGESIQLTEIGVNGFDGAQFLVEEEQTVTLLVKAEGPRPAQIQYRLLSGPGSISPLGLYQWTPTDADATGLTPSTVHTVTVIASDGVLHDIGSFDLLVYEKNYRPVVSAPPKVQYQLDDIVRGQLGPYVARETVTSDTGAAAPYEYQLVDSMFDARINASTGVVSWDLSTAARYVGPVTYGVRVRARDADSEDGYGLSHVLIPGEVCHTPQSCRAAWAPLARDAEVTVYPGQEVLLDLVAQQLIEDVDGAAGDLTILTTGTISGVLPISAAGNSILRIAAPANAGGGSDVTLGYSVVDRDGLGSNEGHIRIHVVDLRPDLDVDIDGNGIIESVDVVGLWEGLPWNDDWLEEHRGFGGIQVPLGGPARPVVWGVDELQSGAFPNNLPYRLTLSQAGSGLVELRDDNGGTIPLDFPLDPAHADGIWNVWGVRNGFVQLTFTLWLNGEEVSRDTVPMTVITPIHPLLEVDAQLESKWVPVAREDPDGDGLPQRSEGYGLIAPPTQDGAEGGPKFVPLTVRLRTNATTVLGSLALDYDAAPPDRSVVRGPDFATAGKLPQLDVYEQGHLRLWKGNLTTRNATPTTVDAIRGSYVPPGPHDLTEFSWVNTGGWLQTTLYVEAVADSTVPLPIRVQFDVDRAAGLYSADQVTVYPIEADLDVDSDNSNQIGDHPHEDDWEAIVNAIWPGKSVPVSYGDEDHDAVIDTQDFASQNERPASRPFTPITLDVRGPGIDSQSRIRFQYSSDNPATNPLEGALRLWIRAGGQDRDPRSVTQGGHFVPHGDTAMTLGMIDWHGGPITLFLEGITAAYQGEIQVDVDPDGPGPAGLVSSDRVKLRTIGVDLDIDSDTTNGLERSLNEENLEADTNAYGQVLLVDNGDRDHDGVPGYAEGLLGITREMNVSTLPGAMVALQLSGLPGNALVRLRYDSSAPNAVVYDASPSLSWNSASGVTVEDGQTRYDVSGKYTLPPGYLRLWSVPLASERNPADLHDGGNYLAPLTEYRVDELSAALSNSQDVYTLWMEAVRASETPQLVSVEIDLDGKNGTQTWMKFDEVKVSPVQLKWHALNVQDDWKTDTAVNPSLANAAGVVVRANDGDWDGDAVPDFADGVDRYGQFEPNASPPLEPVQLEWLGPQAVKDDWRVQFDYAAINPALLVRNPEPNPFRWSYAPGAIGTLRLWHADGTKARSVSDLSSGGDYVAAHTNYAWSQLTDGTFASLFVEGIVNSRNTSADGLDAFLVHQVKGTDYVLSPSLATSVAAGLPAAADSVIDRIDVSVVRVDLDMDTNHDEHIAQSRREDQYEAFFPAVRGRNLFSGQIVPYWAGDVDSDGIPNTSDYTATGAPPAPPFVAIPLSLPEPIDLAQATVEFHYPTVYPFSSVAPADTGQIRLWRKDGVQNRNPLSVNQGGDYLAPDVTFRYADFANSREVMLYVEGISPSRTWGDVRLEVTVDPDGPTGRFPSLLLRQGDPLLPQQGMASQFIRDVVRITVEPQHVVQLSATDQIATEPGHDPANDRAMFTFSRGEGDVAGDLPIYFRVKQPQELSAIVGVDVVLQSSHFLSYDSSQQTGRIVIPAGQSSVQLWVLATDDEQVEWDESLQLAIIPPPSGDSGLVATPYQIGVGQATIRVLDDDGFIAIRNQNADVRSSGEEVASIAGDSLSVDLVDGRIRVAPLPILTPYTPIFVGNEGSRTTLLVDFDMPPSQVGDSLRLETHFGTLSPQIGEYRVPQGDRGAIRIAIPIDATSLPSGMVDYDIELTLRLGSQPVHTKTVRGQWGVQNLSSNQKGDHAFGSGWWIPELDRLTWDDRMQGDGQLPADDHTTYRLTRAGAGTESGIAMLRGDQSIAWFEIPESAREMTVANDNRDPNGQYVEGTGNWSSGTLSGGYRGDYRISAPGQRANALWNLSVEEDGIYELWVTWVADLDRDPQAHYRIEGGQRIDSQSHESTWDIYVDQRLTPGARTMDGQAWYSLGFVRVDAGETVHVTLQGSGLARTVADAVTLIQSLHDAPWDTPIGSFGAFSVHGTGVSWTDKWGNKTVFDSRGRESYHLDRNENRTEFFYMDADGDGRENELLRIQEPTGESITYGYSAGVLSQTVDFAGRVTHYAGSTTRIVELPDPGTPEAEIVRWSLTLDAQERLIALRDPQNILTQIHYASNGASGRYVEAAVGTVAQAAWHVIPLSELALAHHLEPVLNPGSADVVYVDARLHRWTYQVDPFGYKTLERNPRPFADIWRWDRDKNGLVQRYIEPPGAGGSGPLSELVTRYTYDEMGNRIREEYADHASIMRQYDSRFGQVIFEGDSLGREVRTELDAHGNVRVREEVNRGSASRFSVYQYSQISQVPNVLPAGLLLEQTIAAYSSDAVTTHYTYYTGGARHGLPETQVIAFGTPQAMTTRWDYDAFRLIQSETQVDPYVGNRVNQYVNDALGRRITWIQPDPGTGDHSAPVTHWKYDARGQVSELIDPRGTTTHWDYDARHRLVSVVYMAAGGSPLSDPTSMQELYSYDGNGNLVSYSDGRGVTEQRFDERNYRIERTEPDPGVSGSLHGRPVETWEYDAVGNIRAYRDARSHVANEYYATQYAYDARHRLTNTMNPAPGTLDHGATSTQIFYDDAGRKIAESFPAAVGLALRTFEYDDLNRLVRVTEPAVEAGIAVTAWGYDLRGNIIETRDALQRVTRNKYDVQDRLIEELWPETNVADGAQIWRHDYSALGDRIATSVTSTMDSTRSRVWRQDYDRMGRVRSAKQPDPDGDGPLAPYEVQYHYDANGNRVSVSEVVDGVVAVNSTEFDRMNRPWHQIGPGQDGTGTESILVYNRWGEEIELDERVNANSFRTTGFEYDHLGRRVRTTLPPPNVGDPRPTTETWYDANGNLVLERDAMGRTQESFYDRLNRLVEHAEPLDPTELNPIPPVLVSGDSRSTRYRYYPNNLMAEKQDELGHITRWDYDARGHVIRERRPNQEESLRHFDLVGNLVEMEDGMGNVTRWVYDALNRPIAESVFLQQHVLTRTQSYSPWGDLEETVDRNGRSIQYGYDNAGRRVRETWVGDPGGYVASYAYTSRGELLRATDPTSDYRWQYDLAGAVSSQVMHLSTLPGKVFQASYGHDNLLQRTHMQWQTNGAVEYTIGYGHDALGRVNGVTQTGADTTRVSGKSVTMSYGVDGRLDRIRRESNLGLQPHSVGVTEYSYYNDGLLSSIVDHSNDPGISWNSHWYDYDRNGRITHIESPQSGPQDYAYDPADQLVSSKRTVGNVVEEQLFEYDAAGNRLGDMAAQNRLREDSAGRYEYDAEGNVRERWRYSPLAALEAPPSSGTSLQSPRMSVASGWYRVRLDHVELAAIGAQQSVLVRVGYASEEIDSAIDVWKSFVGLETMRFSLEPTHDNRYRIVDGYMDVEVPQNLLDHRIVVLLERTGGGFLGVSQGNASWDRLAEIQEFTWDYRNRLVGAMVWGPDVARGPGALNWASTRTPGVAISARAIHAVRYQYDVLDQRVAKWFDASPRYTSELYVPLEGHGIADYSTNGRLLRRHLYGPVVDQLFATETVDAEGQVRSVAWPLVDHLQTVHDLVTETLTGTGFDIDRVLYDAFGNPTGASPTLDQVHARFTGRDFDAETSLSYHRSRYLMPESGRWLSEDRWWLESGDSNRYRYGGNSPTQQNDPTGADVCGGLCIAALMYVARAAALSAMETGVESGVAATMSDESFSARDAYTRNFTVNLAIGWIPGLAETKVGLRATAAAGRVVSPHLASAAINFAGRVTVGTFGDAAWSSGIEERPIPDAISQAFVGNLAGETIGAGLGRAVNQFNWSRVTAYSEGVIDGLTRRPRSVYLGTLGGGSAGPIAQIVAAHENGIALSSDRFSRGEVLRRHFGHLSHTERLQLIDKKTHDIWQHHVEGIVKGEPYVYRYLTEDGLAATLRYNSVRGYATTQYSASSAEVMSRAQILARWPGSRAPSGPVKYGVAIPVEKLGAVRVSRPFGGTARWGWEPYTNSYPLAGPGGWPQFEISAVPLSDAFIFRLTD